MSVLSRLLQRLFVSVSYSLLQLHGNISLELYSVIEDFVVVIVVAVVDSVERCCCGGGVSGGDVAVFFVVDEILS